MAEISGRVITRLDQVELAWLNRVLRNKGALLAGEVKQFELIPNNGNWSTGGRIILHYSEDASGKLPASLYLKLCRDTFGPSEVYYYTRDYVGLKDAPLPICYDAAYSAGEVSYHLLLADLSQTHTINWERPPTESYGRAVVEGLARLHAYHWGEAGLHKVGESVTGAVALDRYFSHVRPGLEPLLEEIRGEVDPVWIETLQEIFEYHPAKMLERTRDPRGFALLHGDTNPGNILSPLNGDKPVYLLDRQPFDWSLTTWLAVSDLTYMIVTWWEPEVRRELEFKLLRHYHNTLLEQGVQDYSWERLVEDYRLCAIQTFYVATQWCSDESDLKNMKWVWFPQLTRGMAAFAELECRKLWQ